MGRAARPDLGASDLVAEPPAAEVRAVPLVPVIQRHVDILVAYDLIHLLVHLFAMVGPCLRIIPDEGAGLILGGLRADYEGRAWGRLLGRASSHVSRPLDASRSHTPERRPHLWPHPWILRRL